MSAQDTGQRGKVIAITWEQHRRTQGLCAGLGLQLFELTHRGGRLARYLRLVGRTVATLRRERPSTLLVQNPSLILATLAIVLRPWFRYRLVVDAHNEAVQPFIHTGFPVPQLARWVVRKADITIVTNRKLAADVERQGGRPFVLPDRLPDLPIPASAPPAAADRLEVMVIATYAPDEPIAEIFAAARGLQDQFQFHVTGNDRKVSPELRAQVPANVRLTGFLPEHDYWLLMERSHVVLDLTLMPDCLVCGAYEALAMCRPMVLSDNIASRQLFGNVAVLAGASAAEIGVALRSARERFTALSAAAPAEKARFEQQWAADAALLGQKLR